MPRRGRWLVVWGVRPARVLRRVGVGSRVRRCVCRVPLFVRCSTGPSVKRHKQTHSLPVDPLSPHDWQYVGRRASVALGSASTIFGAPRRAGAVCASAVCAMESERPVGAQALAAPGTRGPAESAAPGGATGRGVTGRTTRGDTGGRGGEAALRAPLRARAKLKCWCKKHRNSLKFAFSFCVRLAQ